MHQTIKNTYKEYLELARQIDKTPQGAPLSLAVFHSCTLEPIEPVVRVELVSEGFAPAIKFFGYNIFEQELLNPAGEYGKGTYDVVFLFATLQEFFPELIRDFHNITPLELEKKTKEVVGRMEQLIAAARRTSQPRIILTTFDHPGRWYYGILDGQREHSQKEALAHLNRSIATMASRYKEVYVLDAQDIASRVGKKHFYDWNLYYHSSLPFSSEGLVEIGKELSRIIFAAYGKTKKCIVLDLDNTLWGGVVGVEGADRVIVGPTGSGRAYYDFQLQLKQLSSKGIVLAIASKNNPEDVKEVFSKRKDDMPLVLEDFVITKIGWDTKPQSIQEIAQELDIGLEALVFLDDSPVERELMREQAPEVYTPELPEGAGEYAAFLQELHVFEKNIYSQEDLKKVRIYQDQGKRASLKQEAASLEDFWKGLDMHLTIFVNEKTQIPRLAQMTQKTNQFNLTTRRYSETDITRFMEDSKWQVFSWSVQDKFGDNGIVGLLIVEIQDKKASVDIFLQSCRVIGRTIEQAVVSKVALYLQERGVMLITGEYIPTAKNAVVKDLYSHVGFAKEAENAYVLNLAGTLPAIPPWFSSIEMKVQTHS
ncbi:MAG: HAD-IIIC family phosphatase [bacterium]|nr:HAD-IIIC family phosphatase [bacterium]